MAELKRRHHYVPQFWLRAFRGADNQLRAKTTAGVGVVGTAGTMQEDWLYTVFNDRWTPSDALENALGQLEGQVAPLFQNLADPHYSPTFDDRTLLCEFLGLQAARHPDIIRRYEPRSRDLADTLALVHSVTVAEFNAALAQFGFSASEIDALRDAVLKGPPEQLQAEADEIRAMSSQDSRLPSTDAVVAAPLVASEISRMHLELLEAPNGKAFVLGDTPMPQSDLSQGFTIPIAQNMALSATPATGMQQTLSRRVAGNTEVDAINKVQADAAKTVVVGSDATMLSQL